MRYFSTTQAAEFLGLDPSRVRQLCLRGSLRAMRVNKVYAIAQEDLEAFAAIPRVLGRPRRERGSKSEYMHSGRASIER